MKLIAKYLYTLPENNQFMGELMFRLKRFYRWEAREMRDLLISILAVTFIFGFNDGRESFNLVFWLFNMFKTFIIVAIAILAFDGAMKVTALQQGFRAEYRMWPAGLAIGVIITLLTKGNFPLVLHGGLFLHHMMILRIGKFRYGINVMAQGTIAATGAVAHLILMTIALAFSRQLGILPGFFDSMAVINGYMMIYQLLPIPKMNGIHIFFMSRLAYVFIAATLASYAILTLLGVYSWLLALIIGTLCWFSWYWFVEGGSVKA